MTALTLDTPPRVLDSAELAELEPPKTFGDLVVHLNNSSTHYTILDLDGVSIFGWICRASNRFTPRKQWRELAKAIREKL